MGVWEADELVVDFGDFIRDGEAGQDDPADE